MLARNPETSDLTSQSAVDLFLLGRTLAKSGDLERARAALRRAVDQDRALADAWVWLAMTTEDPAEQAEYLHWAIAGEPAHAGARRWLGFLSGKLQPKDGRPAGAAFGRSAFACRACGGKLRFDPESLDLTCAQCGARAVLVETGGSGQATASAPAAPEGPAWSEAARRQVCRQCGAATIFPPKQTAPFCPFCGGTLFKAGPADAGLLQPGWMLPMRFKAGRAEALLKEWLGRGFFSPDDLMSMGSRHVLRAAYLPAWIFNFDMAVHWQGLVGRSAGRRRDWEWRQDQRVFSYKDQLQPGVRALPLKLYRAVEPFDLSALARVQPEDLGAWPTATYDILPADAVVEAHSAAAAAADKQMWLKAAPGRPLRNFEVKSHDFIGEAPRLALLPVWLGAYLYSGKIYLVLINGQTGKVAGDKPVDRVKVIAVAVGACLVVLLLAALALLLAKGIP
jgi:hypothetical protein